MAMEKLRISFFSSKKSFVKLPQSDLIFKVAGGGLVNLPGRDLISDILSLKKYKKENTDDEMRLLKHNTGEKVFSPFSFCFSFYAILWERKNINNSEKKFQYLGTSMRPL